MCELLADDAEAETAWRGSQRYASRLSPVTLPVVESPVLDPQGRYLITGAFGGLGPLLAEWLVAQGAGALMLIGHRAPSPALAERLQALGRHVRLQIADVADGAVMSRLFAELDREGPPLRGIFHLAGGVADGALLQQDWERFVSVLPAKVEGARILDALTRDRPLDYFVLFSTSAALIWDFNITPESRKRQNLLFQRWGSVVIERFALNNLIGGYNETRCGPAVELHSLERIFRHHRIR